MASLFVSVFLWQQLQLIRVLIQRKAQCKCFELWENKEQIFNIYYCNVIVIKVLLHFLWSVSL